MEQANGPELAETRALEMIPPTALETITKSEIDVAIATAKRFPRSIHMFRNGAEAMATIDPETAGSCFYTLKRKSRDGTITKIEGESVRLAEIAAANYGNFRVGSRIIAEEAEYVVAQGFAHDLETNNWKLCEVRRSIVDRNGKRYRRDMITVTANAACAIAERNATLKVIPRALLRPIYLAAKRAAVGDQTTLNQRREAAVKYFVELGVSRERIFSRLEKDGIEDLDLDDLELLTGLKTAIRDNETTLADAFPDPSAQTPETEGDRSSQLAQHVRRRGRQQPAEREPGSEG